MTEEEKMSKDRQFIESLDMNVFSHKIVKMTLFRDVLSVLKIKGVFTEDFLKDLIHSGNCFEISFFMCRDGDGLFEYVEGFVVDNNHKILHGWNYCEQTDQYFDLRYEANGLFKSDSHIEYHQLIKLDKKSMMESFENDKSIPLIKRTDNIKFANSAH